MKIKPVSLFIIFIYVVIGFVTIFSINYYSETKTIEKLSNSFYDKDAIFFLSANHQIDYKKLYKNLPANTMLFGQLEPNVDVRGIVIKGEISETPRMKSGRFFNEKDFISTTNSLAVVGSGVPTYKKGNKLFIDYNNIQYEVIGVMGYSIPTKLDKTVMISFNQSLINKSFSYSLNGNSYKNKIDFLNNESLFGKITIFERNYPNILKIIDSDGKQVISTIMYYIVLLFNAFLLLFFWVDSKTDEFTVKKINGYDNQSLAYSTIYESWVITSIGYAIGTIAAILFSINKYKMAFHLYFASYILTSAISLLFVYCVVKSKLSKISRGKLGVSW